MMRISCDACGTDLTSGSCARYVVKVEGYSAVGPTDLTEDGFDTDHVEEMAQLLAEQEENPGEGGLPVPGRKAMRFDMCSCCYRKFVADPLGRESAPKFEFSEN